MSIVAPDLAALKAADVSDISMIYDQVTFTWETANAPYTSDEDQPFVTIVESDNAPLSVGAWVRQLADKVSFVPSGPGGVVQPAGTKLAQFVTTADYATLQQAINTGAKEVIVNTTVTVTEKVTLASNQTLRFVGDGKIVVPASATITYPDSVLQSAGGANIVIIDPIIDASETSGVPGIRVSNVVGLRIAGGKLTKCNLQIESTDNSVHRHTEVSGLTIDMDGFITTALYVSGARGVTVNGGSLYDGHEGVGIYNGARAVKLLGVDSHDHTQDGFVVIDGQSINFVACKAYSNGQSGFTTQRQTSGQNSRFITWDACESWNNVFDGFDIRGANSTPWGVLTGFVLNGCIARENQGTGFYVVLAEGTTLNSCVAILNNQQGLFVDTSGDVIANGFRSVSNAGSVSNGISRTGVLVYNSNNVQIGNLISGNGEGRTQDYGVAFTGSSSGGRVKAGSLINNASGPYSLGTGNALSDTKTDEESGIGVFLRTVTEHGIKHGDCFGIPGVSFALTTWPAGSTLTRSDSGGGAEIYAHEGGGVWTPIRHFATLSAVADPSGGSTVDTEARTQLASLLAKLRAAGVLAA